MGIERFEELHAWQEARRLVRLVYELCRQPGLKNDYELRRQMQASAVSSMANIAEAHGRFSFEDKRNFYEISHGSVAELQSHLYVAKDQDFISKEEFDETFECASQVSRLVKGSIDNLTAQIVARRRDRSKGRKSS
jgi:four helix bundle protein